MTLKVEASGLYLSYLWWVIEPILYTLCFYFVFSILFQNKQEHFLLFLMCGKIPYLWFSKSVTTASTSLAANKGLISQIDIPKTIFPYAAVQVSLYKEWPVFLLLFVMAAMYGFYPSSSWVWLLPLMLIQYLMIISLGMLTAVLVCYVDDFRMLINMGMLLLLFVSGIFFDVSAIQDDRLRELILTFNPLSFLINAYRDILMDRGMYSLSHVVKLAVFWGIILTLLHVAYQKFGRAIAAKVVNS